VSGGGAIKARASELWRMARTQVAREASWLLAGHALRVVAQSLGFVLVARALGPSELGSFSAVVGITTLLSPFVHLGAYSLAIRDVVDGVPERQVTGNYLALTTFTLPLALLALLALGRVALPAAPWSAVLGVGLGNLLGVRLTSVFRGVHVARSEVWAAGVLEASSGLAYVLGALVLSRRAGTFVTWAWIYCAQNLAVGVAGVGVLAWRFGRPSSTMGDIRRRLTDGLHFGIGNLAENANAELDKAVLLRLASAGDAGIFAASSRAVAVAMVPVSAFFGAIYRRFFHSGQGGLSASRALALRVAPAALLYGLFAWACIGLGAPWVAALFGRGFADSASVLRWLAPLVLLQTLTYPFLDALTGARMQPVRAVAQIGALAVGLALNLALDARMGWKGAAIASLASQGALLAFASLGAPRLARSARATAPARDGLPRDGTS
jgi:O-antigen/teichoic acid export membrane protein